MIFRRSFLKDPILLKKKNNSGSFLIGGKAVQEVTALAFGLETSESHFCHIAPETLRQLSVLLEEDGETGRAGLKG